MKKFMILATVAICVFSLTTGILYGEERALLVYDDGRIVEMPATDSSTSLPSLESEQDTLAQTVTMDARVFLWDTDPPYEEITEVHPGQQVFLMIGFKRLDSLEIPFDQLIGRTLISLYFLRGKLKHKDHMTKVIESDDGSLGGMGVLYTVPVDAQPRSFLDIGGIFMTGVSCVSNWDWRIYPVVE